MTEIDFFVGFDPVSPIPRVILGGGLDCRFAVIQHTSVTGCDDLYFDESLWMRWVEFARSYCSGGEVRIVAREGEAEVGVEAFVAAWRGAETVDGREPPQLILARDQGKIVLCISTEDWARLGGPWPYHDSYTYSIFSKEEVAERVMAFLAEAEASRGWRMAVEPILAGAVRRPWTSRFRRWLFRAG